MSFKARTFLVSAVLSAVIYFLMFLMFSTEGHFLAGLFPEGGLRYLACLIFGIVASLITCACVFLFSKNVKEQNAIMEEVEKNGYSDRFVEMLRTEVGRLSGKELTQLSFNYIIMLADAYLMKGRPEEAMRVINIVNPRKDPIFSPSKPMGINNQIKFYSLQIGICEPLRMVDRANAIMNEAMPVLTKNMGKLQSNDLIIYETMCVYYLLIGRNDEAMRYADACFRYNSRSAKFLGNVQKVRVYSYIQDLNAAYQHYSIAEGLVEKPVERDIMNYLQNYYLRTPAYN